MLRVADARYGVGKNTNTCTLDGTVMEHHVSCHYSLSLFLHSDGSGDFYLQVMLVLGLFLGELATLAGKMSYIPCLFSFAFVVCLQNVPGAPLSAQTDQLGVASVHLT